MTKRRLLIVEDDDVFFGRMEPALKQELEKRKDELMARGTEIEYVRVKTMKDARMDVIAFPPDVVSIDMQFPEWGGQKPAVNAGAKFLAYVKQEHPAARCLFYSSTDQEEINRHLTNQGVAGLAETLRKVQAFGHDAWAKYCLEQLLLVS